MATRRILVPIDIGTAAGLGVLLQAACLALAMILSSPQPVLIKIIVSLPILGVCIYCCAQAGRPVSYVSRKG